MNTNIMEFLKLLQQNNNREWFEQNKTLYELARKEFIQFIEILIREIQKFDKDIDNVKVKDCLFRIYRDVRFSKDKLPYKTNFGAYIAPQGRKSVLAGYYFHVEPSGVFVAGGNYMPEANALHAIRQEIYFHSSDFKKIIHDKTFEKYFPKLDESSKLKKPPKDFSSDFADIDLLKYKNYDVMHQIDESMLYDKNLADYVLETFRIMFPFISFLRNAVKMI